VAKTGFPDGEPPRQGAVHAADAAPGAEPGAGPQIARGRTHARPQGRGRAALSDADCEALERAIAMCRAESEQERAHIDRVLAAEGWQQAGETAAYHQQDRRLKLKPWEMSPCQFRGDIDSYLAATSIPASSPEWHDYRGARQAALLIKRLLAAGLSKYEPDPETALKRKTAN
jgi:hypothetical protein